jgi:preprotein translocase SecF subunit
VTYKFDFVKYHKIYFLITTLLMVISIASLFYQGLNLGIDFRSGSRLDIELGPNVQLEKERKILQKLGYEHANLQVGGPHRDRLIFHTNQVLNRQEVQKIKQEFSKAHKKEVSIQEQVVDPIIGRELAKNAIYSVLIASIGIVLYVTLRFEYRFAIAAILTLFYDVLVTVGVFSLFQIEVDVVFIAAILTIVGYSINDTIVIFDRIREHINRINPKKWSDMAKVVNLGINQTLVRSLNTVLTVFFVALTLYLMGSDSMKNFSFALMIGLLSGAYSSIFVAAQIWLLWKQKDIKKA